MADSGAGFHTEKDGAQLSLTSSEIKATATPVQNKTGLPPADCSQAVGITPECRTIVRKEDCEHAEEECIGGNEVVIHGDHQAGIVTWEEETLKNNWVPLSTKVNHILEENFKNDINKQFDFEEDDVKLSFNLSSYTKVDKETQNETNIRRVDRIQVYAGCFDEKSCEHMNPTEAENQLSFKNDLDCTLRDSITRGKDSKNIFDSPTIESFITRGNGIWVIKIRGGKVYSLPFVFTTTPKVECFEGFQHINHLDVWYRLNYSSVGKLCLQNVQSKNYIELYDFSESLLGGNETDKKCTNGRHGFSNECTMAETLTVLEGFRNSSADTDHKTGGEIVTKTDKKACKRHENDRGETNERDTDEKHNEKTEEKSENGASISYGWTSQMKKEYMSSDQIEIPEGNLSQDATTHYHGRENIPEGRTGLEGSDKIPKYVDKISLSCASSSEIISEERPPDPPSRKRKQDSTKSVTEKSKQLDWRSNEGNFHDLKLLIMYHKKLGKKNITDVFKHVISCSLNFKLMWNFCTQTDCGKKIIDPIVVKQCCQISLHDHDDLKEFFKFKVSDEQFQDESSVKDFVDAVLRKVYNCVQESLSIQSVEIDPRIKEDVLDKLKERKEVGFTWIELVDEGNSVAVYSISQVVHMTSAMQIMKAVIADASESFFSHENMVDVDYTWYTVLTKLGYLVGMADMFPNTKISQVDEKNDGFFLKGHRDEVEAAVRHLKELQKKAREEVQEQSFYLGNKFEHFTYSEMHHYIDTVVTEQYSQCVAWILNHQTKRMHIFSRQQARNIDKIIKGCVQIKQYQLSIIHPRHIRLIEELKNKYRGKLVIHQSNAGLLVTAADDIFESVDTTMQDILEMIARERDNVSESPDDKDGQVRDKMEPNIADIHQETSGLLSEKGKTPDRGIMRSIRVWDENLFRKIVQQHFSEFKENASKHGINICILEVPGKFGFQMKGSEKEVAQMSSEIEERIKSESMHLHLPKEDNSARYTEDVEDKTNSSHDNVEPSMQPSNPVLHFEKVEVRVETGELSQTKADVIVNTTSENLDLKVGTISKSILKAAGQTIQDECKKAYPYGISLGKVAITSGGEMKCKNIFHGALTSSKDWDKILKKFVDACLTQVSNMKFKSIAFPALGTGILKLPRDQVAHIMTSCVKEFSSGQSNTLEKVTFVIYHRDEMTLKVFQDTILKFKAAEKEKTESSDFEIHVTGLKDKVKEVITSIETELKKVPEEDTDVPGSCPSATNLSEVDQDDSIVYIECKIEVAEDILNSIKITYGQQGIDSLISDLDKLAKVDTQKDRILVFCDYKDAENVQKCVRNHYNKVNEERKMKEENKHLIHGENENLKEWLQFAYGHTSWSKNLQLEGGKLYLTGTLQMKREVEKAVHSMNYWYKEEFTLNSEEQQKADEVVAVIKSELPTIFIKQTKEIIIVLSDNRDNFERACFKVKVVLGRIKITARGRRHRDPLSYGESYSGLSKNDKMDAEPY